MSKLNDALAKLNGISPVVLLWANIVLALLVLVAHGGFLLLVLAGKAPQYADDVAMTYITIPLALLVIAASLAALLRASLRSAMLKLQSIILVMGALAMTFYGASVAVSGIPPGTNFVWNPVLFAIVVAYPVYLMQRSFARVESPVNSVALQAPIWAMGVSVVISTVIMWRIGSVAT